MKTIKELEGINCKGYNDDYILGRVHSSQDILGLMKEIREGQAVITTQDWEELKARIKG